MNFDIDNATRIAIVDKDAQWVKGLSIILSEYRAYKIVSRYDTISDLLKEIKELNPQIILINAAEVDEHDMHGYRKIKFYSESIQIISFSDTTNDELVLRCISYGSSGYLVGIKSHYKELVQGLEKIHKGIPPLSKGAALALVNHFHGISNSSLTNKETEVILQLKEGKSATEVADSLNMAKDTVRKHVANIYKKLDVNNRAQAFEKLFF